MTVLDASAVLALIHNELGHDLVAKTLHGATSGGADRRPRVAELDLPIQVRLIR